MSTTTTRNDLVKPGLADSADISVINSNYDIIDASFALCNWAGTDAPDANDDTDAGYSIGSVWFDRTNNNLYVAKTVTSGAAVWTLRAAHNNYSATGAPDADNDITEHYAPGSVWLDVTNHNVYMCEDATDGAAVWKQVNSAAIAGYVKTDGSTPLTANWDVGAYKMTASQLESDVASGTAPFVVASTTQVANLKAATCGLADNSSQLNGIADTGFVKQTLADAKGDLIVASGADTWARQAVSATDSLCLVSDASATNGVSWQPIYGGVQSNLLINPSFRVNQHGVSTVTSATTPNNNDDTYVVDQWTLLSDGNDIMDIWPTSTTHASGADGSVLLQTETANKKAGIIQFLDYSTSRAAVGDVVSLRFSAYTNSTYPNANIMAGVLSWSSTGDTLTSDVVSAWNAAGAAPTLISNWTFENTPSQLALVNDTWTEYKIENIAIDTASTTNIAVFIWLDDTDSTVDDRLYISKVQLNVGPVCLPYNAPSTAVQFTQCKRHYMVWNADAAAYGHLGTGPANDTQYVYTEWPHPTQFFKTAAAVTMTGNWTTGATIESMTSECILSQIVIRSSDDGKGLTANHSYIVYANNDTTARVQLASRL